MLHGRTPERTLPRWGVLPCAQSTDLFTPTLSTSRRAQRARLRRRPWLADGTPLFD